MSLISLTTLDDSAPAFSVHRLVQQVMRIWCSDLHQTKVKPRIKASHLLNQFATHLVGRAEFAATEPLMRRALQIVEESFWLKSLITRVST